MPALLIAAVLSLLPMPAEATMYKCTARDGTVLYQARPCGVADREAPVGNAGLADSMSADPATRKRESQERAIVDREEAQRRARCASYRETLDGLKPMLEASSEATRNRAVKEQSIQERRMRDDRCATT